MKTLSAQWIMPALALGAMRFVDDTSPVVLWLVRVVAVVEFLAAIAVHVGVRRAIVAAADATPLTYPDPARRKGKKKGPVPMVESTVRAYDMAVWGREVTTTIVAAAALAVVHLLFGSFVSLWIGAFTAPPTVLESPLFRVHWLGREVPRPFDEPESATSAIRDDWKKLKQDFADINAQAAANADPAKAAIAEAQRLEGRLEVERRRQAAARSGAKR
jgi:hypothetical protein